MLIFTQPLEKWEMFRDNKKNKNYKAQMLQVCTKDQRNSKTEKVTEWWNSRILQCIKAQKNP